MSDRLAELLQTAFSATCEAEKIIYGPGYVSELKSDIISAHSALLSAKNEYASILRKRHDVTVKAGAPH